MLGGRHALFLFKAILVMPWLCPIAAGAKDLSYFYLTRTDRTIPLDCRPLTLPQYADIREVATVGPADVNEGDFNLRLPLTEKQLRLLHEIVRQYVGGHVFSYEEEVRMAPVIRQVYREVGDLSRRMGFSLKPLGRAEAAAAIAELIAIREYKKRFPEHEYFVTGGIAYYHPGQSAGTPTTKGELDIVVVHRATCKVVAIAEVKSCSTVDLTSAKKALNQMGRFRDFLYDPLVIASDSSFQPQCYDAFSNKPPTFLRSSEERYREAVANRNTDVLDYPPHSCPEVFGEFGTSH